MAIGVYGGRCVEKHSAFIFDRGGQRRIGQILDLSAVDYERARDNVAEGSIRVEGDACAEQADFLAAVRSHRHELVIYRGRERVFEGPIHRTASHGSYMEIIAHDVSEYLFHQPLTRAYDNRNTAASKKVTTVTNRMQGIIEYEFTHGRTQRGPNGATVVVPAWESLDPPVNIVPHLVVHHWPNEAETSAYTVPFEMTVGEHLQNYAQHGGIDWTAVGRAIHIWDVSRSLGRLEQMTDANFIGEGVIVSEYGADHTQAAYVIAQNGQYGSAINPQYLDYYGPWTNITTAYNEEGTADPTQAELASQAARNVAGVSPVPVEVRIPDNSTLVLTDWLTLNMLVPGVEVPLRATLNARRLTLMQKIDHVVVHETADGESVQLTLTPRTRNQDSDVEEEEEED